MDEIERLPERLKGGLNEVLKVGSTVVRPTGTHSPAVHAFLLHLERAEFDWSPRFLSTDVAADTETLSYLEGETTDYPLAQSFQTDSAMISAARPSLFGCISSSGGCRQLG